MKNKINRWQEGILREKKRAINKKHNFNDKTYDNCDKNICQWSGK